ncbi:uncharacterized protein LOC129547315 [Moschus berezovskii]|uniref:uncharacterized protein LOC129547315 n=1 Tax=Moschus berezovskii TaxID=68408 RepID=UPI00244526E2|nr:uncharacterized protein LOC129547315 [Moschus berezovskii]
MAPGSPCGQSTEWGSGRQACGRGQLARTCCFSSVLHSSLVSPPPKPLHSLYPTCSLRDPVNTRVRPLAQSPLAAPPHSPCQSLDTREQIRDEALAAPGRPPSSFPAGAGCEGGEATIPSPEAFSTSVCSEKAVQEPVPATKRGLPRLSPRTRTTTSTTVGDPEPTQTPTLSSLPPQDFRGVADLTSTVQMWKLRLTKVKSLATVTKQRWARKTVAPPQRQHP